MAYEVHILHEGYSRLMEHSMFANCTCTLLKGQHNIIIDTMTPWDKNIIIDGMKKHNVTCDDIDYVICTHGHSDHIGNNNLFLRAKQHIVGYSINHKDQYYLHPFETGEVYNIDDDVSIIPTPGHTSDDVTVLVKSRLYGTVAVAGDLFEKKEDLEDPSLWRDLGGSRFPEKQEANRNRILRMADHIVPGHGPMFKVPGFTDKHGEVECVRPADGIEHKNTKKKFSVQNIKLKPTSQRGELPVSKESEETRDLSLAQLERVVLLDQLKFYRMQLKDLESKTVETKKQEKSTVNILEERDCISV